MKKILTLTCLACMVLFGIRPASAQCPNPVCTYPPDPAAPALCLLDACVLCDLCLLNGYIGETIPFLNACDVPPPFCGSVDNNQWFAFLAPPSGQVSLYIDVLNCFGTPNGSGMQAQIYGKANGCSEFFPVSGCVNPGVPIPLQVDATGLVPFDVYYLMLDGWAGDFCTFQITVLDGCMTSPAVDPPMIEGPTSVCVGQVAEYTVDYEILTDNNGGQFPVIWSGVSPLGEIIYQEGKNITVLWHHVGTVNLHIFIAENCFGSVFSESITVQVSAIPETLVDTTVCSQACIDVGVDVICQPGTYQYIFTSFQGCDSTVIYHVEWSDPSFSMVDTVMPCEGFLVFDNDTLTSPGSYEIIYPNAFGCDSVVHLTLAPGLVNPAAGPDFEVNCTGGFSLQLQGSSIDPGTGILFFWETQNGHIVSGADTPTPTVDVTGTYCLTVTDTISGCKATDCTEVRAGTNQPVISFEQPAIPCNGPVDLTATISPVDPTATYLWTTTNGHIVSGETSLTVVVDAAGEYCLTMTSAAGCAATACVELASEIVVDLSGPTNACGGFPTEHLVQVSGTAAGFTLFLQVNNGAPQEISVPAGTGFFVWQNNLTAAATLAAWAVDSTGCESNTDTLQVAFNEPSVSFETTQTVCGLASIEAVYNGTASAYAWSTGATTPAISVSQNGWYSVTVSEGGGCEASDSIFLQMDFTGNCSYIVGTVKKDALNNCAADPSDTGLNGWMVQATGTGGNFYAITTLGGSYNLPVTPGSYTVTVTPPSANWSVCQNAVLVTLPMANSSAAVNFLAQPVGDCPVMTVDISTGLLRVCQQNSNSFKYCNTGTATATDAYVLLTIDPLLDFVSASAGYTNLGGGVYRFNVGDVEPGECHTVYFTTMTKCNAPVGFTHCNQAHVFPDTACAASNPLWSGANLEVAGSCADSVRFVVQNNGTGTLSGPLKVLVFKNTQIYLYQEFAPLAPGEVRILAFPANGATWRAEVTQEIYHPANALVTATVEGCGTSTGGTVSTGFVDNMYAGDPQPYLDIDCRPNIGSYDPNVKQASPVGYGPEHFITGQEPLEYQIRFQNTGQSEALSVVVRDTLSPLFDLTTLVMGASSHPYEWELLGNGILKVEFPGIVLTSRDLDEPNSIGFFEFEIKLKPGLLPLTVIENEASVYFDYNEPVATNRTFHTIEKPVVHSFQQLQLCSGEAWNGLFFTADTIAAATFEFPLYDSMAWAAIQVLPQAQTTLAAQICSGGTYPFGGSQLTTAGVYENVLSTAAGCDSTVTLTLTVADVLSSSLSATICSGDSYLFGGQALVQPGEYTATFTSSGGCDSIVSLNLAVVQPVQTFLEATICAGEGYEWQGSIIRKEGDYKVVLPSFIGCDSIVNLSLQVLPTAAVQLEAAICSGETFVFNGEVLTAPGMYTAIFTAANGCDSTQTLQLSLLPDAVAEWDLSICEGESIVFNGQEISTAGIYEAHFPAANGCDSLLVLHLAVAQNMADTVAQVVSYGTVFNGVPLTQDTVFAETFTAANGCDSTVVYLFQVTTPTGEALATALGLSVFPNPSDGLFYLRFELPEPMEIGVEATDVLAKKLALQHPAQLFAEGQQLLKMDASTWPSGVYLIRLLTPDGAAVVRVVVD